MQEMNCTDDWVATALADDAVVVEFLLRLRQSTAAVSLPRPTLAWGRRRARSKPKKNRDPMTRGSPTTPLYWSCGGGGGAASSASPSDDSRPSDLSCGGRSKGTLTNDSIASSSGHHGSKRKKSFTELHAEETVLLQERLHLKNELETVRVLLKKQNVESLNLKRLKTDEHQQSAFGLASKASYEEGLRIDRVPASNSIRNHDDHVAAAAAAANPFEAEKGFVLPDLNMMPSEDDFPLIA